MLSNFMHSHLDNLIKFSLYSPLSVVPQFLQVISLQFLLKSTLEQLKNYRLILLQHDNLLM